MPPGWCGDPVREAAEGSKRYGIWFHFSSNRVGILVTPDDKPVLHHRNLNGSMFSLQNLCLSCTRLYQRVNVAVRILPVLLEVAMMRWASLAICGRSVVFSCHQCKWVEGRGTSWISSCIRGVAFRRGHRRKLEPPWTTQPPDAPN